MSLLKIERKKRKSRAKVLAFQPRYTEEVYALDALVFGAGQAWSADTWGSSIGYVAIRRDLLVGALCPILVPMGNNGVILIARMMVLPDARRQGVGTALIDRLKERAGNSRVRWVTANVPDDRLEAQCFFRSCGFEAILPIKRIAGKVYYFMRWEVPRDAAV